VRSGFFAASDSINEPEPVPWGRFFALRPVLQVHLAANRQTEHLKERETMSCEKDDEVTVDDLRAIHPGAPGEGDAGAFLAALDEGWPPGEVLTQAVMHARLARQQDTPPLPVEPWLRSLGSPPPPLAKK
jgi:hypothetical protein